MSTKEAARQLNITDRQVRRLLSERRGQVSGTGSDTDILTEIVRTHTKGKHRNPRRQMPSSKCQRRWNLYGKKYCLQISNTVYQEYLELFRMVCSECERSGDWSDYGTLQGGFLRKYAVVAVGYNLPPGAELPTGHCFGRHGVLAVLPVEESRPPGTCWDDADIFEDITL